MVCDRKYRILDVERGFIDFSCESLRKHYAEVSSNKKTSSAYVKQIREALMKCPECNQSRIDMLKELNPKNSEVFLKPYENLV